jgi:hypothetical protein
MKTLHGQSNTRLHRIWKTMKSRCGNPNFDMYRHYGARGIAVCPEWQESFIAFRDWSLANGYADDLSIDRIDNDGNYEPSNCQWVDRLTQNRNRRDNTMVTAFGETKAISAWADDPRCAVKYKTLVTRLQRWADAEQAITLPTGSKVRT